jgi:plastocyanin
VLLDRVDWQTGNRGRTRAVLKIAPSSEEVCPVRRTLTILVLVAGALLAAGCASEGGDEEPAGAGPAASTTSAAAGGAAGGGGVRGDYGGPYGGGSEPATTRGSAASGDAAGGVRIEGLAFDPATVDAKVGQQVTWRHRDAGVTHTVTAVGGEFDSGELAEGDEFSHRFQAAGSFAYRCAIHPDMRGTVEVGG